MGRVRTIAPFIAALALYLGAALVELHLPGPSQDELLQIVPGMQLVYGTLTSDWPGLPEIGGQTWPVMSFPYIGALKTYLTLPLWFVLEPSVEAVRVLTASLGLLGLALTYLLARQVFGPTPAGFATLLLAGDPSYVLGLKHDSGPVAIAFILRVATTLLLLGSWRTRRRRWLLAGAGLLAGVGIWNKLDFAWFVGAVAVAGLYLLVRRRITGWQAGVFLGALVAGGGPLIWFNFASGGGTFGSIAEGFTGAGPLGPAALPILAIRNVVEYLPARLVTLATTLDGTAMPHAILLETLPFHSAAPLVFAAAAVWTLARPHLPQRVLLLLIASIVLSSAALEQTNKTHHLFNVYPFPHLLGGSFLAGLAGRPRGHRLAAALLAATLASSLAVLGSYSARLQDTGGVAFWSDALYSATDAIQQQHCASTLVAVDWGIDLPVTFFSRNRCPTVRLFPLLEGETQDVANTNLPRWLGRPDIVYGVFADWVVPTYGVGRSRDRFWREVRRQGDEVTVEQKVFTQRDGREVLSLVRITSFEGWVRHRAEDGRMIPPPEIAARLDGLGPGFDFREGPSDDQLGRGWYPLEVPGPFAFRWIGDSARAYLRAPGARQFQVGGESPSALGPDQLLIVVVNGQPSIPFALGSGAFDLEIAATPGADGYTEVELRVARTFVPSGGDRRRLGLMVRRLGFT